MSMMRNLQDMKKIMIKKKVIMMMIFNMFKNMYEKLAIKIDLGPNGLILV
jgi:hypothetical protein